MGWDGALGDNLHLDRLSGNGSMHRIDVKQAPNLSGVAIPATNEDSPQFASRDEDSRPACQDKLTHLQQLNWLVSTVLNMSVRQTPRFAQPSGMFLDHRPLLNRAAIINLLSRSTTVQVERALTL